MKLPKPYYDRDKELGGVHPRVCCPKFSDPKWICFEENWECAGPPLDEDYVDEDFLDEDYFDEDYYLDSFHSFL